MSTLDDEERYLLEMLGRLQKEYHKAAEPYVNRLTAIYAMRKPAPMVLPMPDREPPP